MDITKIDGYKPGMTEAEQLALILKYEPPVADYTGYIKKSSFDQTASELAEAKKQLKAKMTEDEQKEAERAAKEAEKDALLASLQKENAITKGKARFLGLGYDEKLATETAEALADGNMDKVFENQKIYIESIKKAEHASELARDPKPEIGRKAGEQVTDYSKAILEAQNNYDYGLAAMLMRQQQEANSPK